MSREWSNKRARGVVRLPHEPGVPMGGYARRHRRRSAGLLLALMVQYRCSMKDMIDVLELLASQHTEVDQLIEQIESGEGDRAALFTELADKLAAHATVEEKIFYPAAMDAKTSEMLHEAVEEHLSVKRLLADLMELDAEDEDEQDEFEAKIALLKEQVTHHAHEEEEGKLFPILRQQMSEDERAAIGNEVLAMFELLMQEEPRLQVPAETAEAAPLPSV
jgi:hemerythrin superfamily protein